MTEEERNRKIKEELSASLEDAEGETRGITPTQAEIILRPEFEVCWRDSMAALFGLPTPRVLSRGSDESWAST